MSIENLPVIKTMIQHLQQFEHPSIDTLETEVKVLPTQQSVVLEVRLYNLGGEYIVEDPFVCNFLHIPGMQFSVYPHARRIHIENCYLRSEYQGRRIGTTFVNHLLEAERESCMKKASLVADIQTDAALYWKKIHHFQSINKNHPQYLERKL